jgi:hypothetical protein
MSETNNFTNSHPPNPQITIEPDLSHGKVFAGSSLRMFLIIKVSLRAGVNLWGLAEPTTCTYQCDAGHVTQRDELVITC